MTLSNAIVQYFAFWEKTICWWHNRNKFLKKKRSLKELTQPKPWKIMKPRMCQMMETEKGCQFCFIVLWYTCKSICEKITVNVLLYITAIAAVFNN